MFRQCLDSIMVLMAFGAVYILPPLWTVLRFRPMTGVTERIVMAAGLGLSSQAILGMVWNHLVRHAPVAEGWFYYLFWLMTSLLFAWLIPSPKAPKRRPLYKRLGGPVSIFGLCLMAIIAAGIGLRSIDALTHASLGQSDAYTHLQFLRDVISRGQIRNIVYPPGYSWVLALPTLTFNLDAYLVARYVGPFFGALMIATLALLGRRYSAAAGLFAAFLAALCPFLEPLIKTGMGAFANQIGLFLLPLAILIHGAPMAFRHAAQEVPAPAVTEGTGQWNIAPFLFTVILLGLTATVPIFLFNLAMIMGLFALTRHFTAPSVGKPKRVLALARFLLPFLLALGLASWHFLRPGELHLTTTAVLVTGIETPAKEVLTTKAAPTLVMRLKANNATKLAMDWLTVKRTLRGGGIMNVAGGALGALFIGILAVGLRRKVPFLMLLGLWGLLTTVQVTTGMFDFSLYQRSGWLLLQAITLAGGVIAAALYDGEKARKVMRPLIGVGCALLAVAALAFPPQHRCITSGAENELAMTLRELSSARLRALRVPKPAGFEQLDASPLLSRAATASILVVVTRRYTLFNADQGNLADVLPDPAAQIRQYPIAMDTRLKFHPAHFLCLIDREAPLPDMGLMARIAPALTQSLSGFQSVLYKPNEVILAYLESLPTDAWTITKETRGPNLTLYLVERKDKP